VHLSDAAGRYAYTSTGTIVQNEVRAIFLTPGTNISIAAQKMAEED
jgi:hypothetical protein